MEDRRQEIASRRADARREARKRPRSAGSGVLLPMAAFLAALLGPGPRVAGAASLDQKIPGLFGGTLTTTIDPGAQKDVQEVAIAERFRGLSASLAAARSQAPIPSASGAFRFAWDPELDTFVRHPQSLGSMFAERARTLGRRVFTLSFSYTRVDFDTLEGDNLNNLRASQAALSADYLAQLPPDDQAIFSDDILQTQLDLAFGFDLFYFTAAYGVTDNIDVSIALSVNRARMRGRALANILDPNQNGSAVFAADQPGVITDGSVPGCETPFICARDGFDDSAFGTGDLFLRAKWHFAETDWADFSTTGVLTLPTGNADDFLGYHDVTFTPWLVVSKSFNWFAPHVNLGYSLRSHKDVSQAMWIAGTDLLAAEWLTLSADFLGYHDDKRDGINDDVFQSALGFKIHPFGRFVLGGNFQLPLNRDGLRSDVIYSTQLEYTF
jgi:hypothetical protein